MITLSEDLYSTSGVSTDADGNFFYSSEPTMPADESKLFFVQFVMGEDIDPKTGLGEFRTAIYYIEKE